MGRPGRRDEQRPCPLGRQEVGFYHFLDDQDGIEQARHFIRGVKRANRGKDAQGRKRKGSIRDVVIVADVERNPGEGGSPTSADVRAFLAEVRRLAPKNRLLVYSAEGYWRSIGNPDVRELVDGLWQARWDEKRHTCQRRQLPAEWPRAGFGGWRRPRWWQFGALKGEHGSLDGNAYFGTEARFRSLFQTVTAAPGADPDPILDPDEGAAIRDLAGSRKGYNAVVDAAAAQLRKLNVPDRGDAFDAGAAEALRDLAAIIEATRLRGEEDGS